MITKNLLLTALGVTSMGASVYCAARATKIATKRIDRRKMELFTEGKLEKDADLSFGEKFKLSWKLYIPAAILFAGGASCCIASQQISAKLNRELSATLASSMASSAIVQKKLEEKLGEDKTQEVFDEIAKENIKDIVENSGDGFGVVDKKRDEGVQPVTFFDCHGNYKVMDTETSAWTTTTKNVLESAVLAVRERWLNGEDVSWADYLFEIGCDSAPNLAHKMKWFQPGERYGWRSEHPVVRIGFGEGPNGEPAYTITPEGLLYDA